MLFLVFLPVLSLATCPLSGTLSGCSSDQGQKKAHCSELLAFKSCSGAPFWRDACRIADSFMAASVLKWLSIRWDVQLQILFWMSLKCFSENTKVAHLVAEVSGFVITADTNIFQWNITEYWVNTEFEWTSGNCGRTTGTSVRYALLVIVKKCYL